MTKIVVGVDGSSDAQAAAKFAAGEARLRGAALHVVCSWMVPPSVYMGGMPWSPPELHQALEDQARGVCEAAIAELDGDGVEITTVVREGQPAQVLLGEADGAAMLVVGSRGLGGFKGLVLGSVSAQCAQHAHCPVVIVRGQ